MGGDVFVDKHRKIGAMFKGQGAEEEKAKDNGSKQKPEGEEMRPSLTILRGCDVVRGVGGRMGEEGCGGFQGVLKGCGDPLNHYSTERNLGEEKKRDVKGR